MGTQNRGTNPRWNSKLLENFSPPPPPPPPVGDSRVISIYSHKSRGHGIPSQVTPASNPTGGKKGIPSAFFQLKSRNNIPESLQDAEGRIHTQIKPIQHLQDHFPRISPRGTPREGWTGGDCTKNPKIHIKSKIPWKLWPQVWDQSSQGHRFTPGFPPSY